MCTGDLFEMTAVLLSASVPTDRNNSTVSLSDLGDRLPDRILSFMTLLAIYRLGFQCELRNFSTKAFPTVMMTEANQQTSEPDHNEEKLPPASTQHTGRTKSVGRALIISYDTTSSCSHECFEKVPIRQDELQPEQPVQNTIAAFAAGQVHSVFTPNQKRFIVFMAAWVGFFSPVSGAIYFPALNSLARDLKVSNALINATLTSYMVGLPVNIG